MGVIICGRFDISYVVLASKAVQPHAQISLAKAGLGRSSAIKSSGDIYLVVPIGSGDAVVKPEGSSESLHTEASPKQLSTAESFSSTVMLN